MAVGIREWNSFTSAGPRLEMTDQRHHMTLNVVHVHACDMAQCHVA